MIEALKKSMSAQGEKLRVLPVELLKNLRAEIGAFRAQDALNDFQKWIADSLYRFEIPPAAFPVRSIILVAVPHPAYAVVEFTREGKKYNFLSLVMPDFDRCERKLNDFLAPRNHRIQTAINLPLKRLAVQSSLAVYGRNNICYIEGLGSQFSFAAFFSDLPGEEIIWTEVRQAEICAHCEACLRSCPTGAISADRFLIDNEKCLSFLNEAGGTFPDWLPISAHHCLYDCLKCQIPCPMNKDHIGNVAGPIAFNAEETEMLLSGVPFDSYSSSLKRKAELLGLNQWPAGIPRNLRVLFELSDRASLQT